MTQLLSLAETVIWALLVLYVLCRFGGQFSTLIEAVTKRIASGSSVKVGPFEVGHELARLEKVSPAPGGAAPPPTTEWSIERDSIYESNSGLFLAHIISPSPDPAQKFDVFVYLVRHKSNDWSDIDYAEFFFGEKWSNKVFHEKRRNGLIGIATSAYGPFLCTCRVRMKDGRVVRLHRYIDFEMGRMFDSASNFTPHRVVE